MWNIIITTAKSVLHLATPFRHSKWPFVELVVVVVVVDVVSFHVSLILNYSLQWAGHARRFASDDKNNTMASVTATGADLHS